MSPAHIQLCINALLQNIYVAMGLTVAMVYLVTNFYHGSCDVNEQPIIVVALGTNGFG
jgi:hypothetical protein